MPTYTYKCKAGHHHDRIRTIGDRDAICPCPKCGKRAKRDVVASMEGQASTDQEYVTPVYSNALAVPPSQIRQAQKRFPHHEFAPDGRMILRSHNHRKRVMRELGYMDRDSYN